MNSDLPGGRVLLPRPSRLSCVARALFVRLLAWEGECCILVYCGGGGGAGILRAIAVSVTGLLCLFMPAKLRTGQKALQLPKPSQAGCEKGQVEAGDGVKLLKCLYNL